MLRCSVRIFPTTVRSQTTELFDSPLSARHIERFADPARWVAAFTEVGASLDQEEVGSCRSVAGASAARGDGQAGSIAAGSRRLYRLGSATARERVWIQFDAAFDARAAAFSAWAIIDSLSGTRVSRYRHLLLGRAHMAVLTPEATATVPRAAAAAPPLLDAGALGFSSALLSAMERFAPTLVVHVQDWTGAERAPAVAVMSPPAPRSPNSGGFRFVESFHLAPELHARLGEAARRRSWFGRPTATARELAAHPDAQVGYLARRYVTRMGYDYFERGERSQRGTSGADPSRLAVLRLAPSRYVPRPEWRRLGAASLGEIALSRFGALALCGQMLDVGVTSQQRAGAFLAFAEAVIIHRLNLAAAEPAA